VNNKLNIILLFCLNFILSSTTIANETQDQSVSILPVNASQIDSITVEPQQGDNASNYVLKILLDSNNGTDAISIIRPLDGTLVDLKLNDLDEDGIDEVIVIMADQNTTAVHIHLDIFEFDGKNISLVKNFTHMAKLYELFDFSKP
jgi:hypothetical protein